jgi:hypothetical protein
MLLKRQHKFPPFKHLGINITIIDSQAVSNSQQISTNMHFLAQ